MNLSVPANYNTVWEEVGFFVNLLKSLRVSESLTLEEGKSFCVSTATDFENWIYWPENITSPELVNKAVNFFRERDQAFMWPVISGEGEILGNSGLIYAGDLTAMTLKPEKIPDRKTLDLTFQPVTLELADEWAKTAWQGFGGDAAEVPENYYNFVKALTAKKDKIALYLAKYDGHNAGTFAVTQEELASGVYYFATLPEFRRMGVASAMMTEICGLSTGKNIVLQSTPRGVNFYRAFGFSELCRLPVYSTDSDIF